MEYPAIIRIQTVSSLVIGGLVIGSCGMMTRSQKYRSGDYQYEFRQKGTPYQKSWVQINNGDSITILSYSKPDEVIRPASGADQFFRKRSVDFDAMTVGFKYRPAAFDLPRQLNTDFNGNAYVGYRWDRTRRREENTPFGTRVSYGHRAVSAGVFGGIGSTAIAPWTTNYATIDEYNGLILTRGLGFMIALSDLNVGLGVGWDYLTDRDKNIWIYQNKPWYGLTIGLNLTNHPSLNGNVRK